MKPQPTSKTLNVILWIAQILCAMAFIWSAYMKFFRPEELPFPWISENPKLVTITAIVDLLGGVGILLPSLLRIQPKLTVYAAYGIILLMVSASVFHISRGEAKDIGFNIFMVVLAGFIAWGRKSKVPIASKN